jgi:hypothetical protein
MTPSALKLVTTELTLVVDKDEVQGPSIPITHVTLKIKYNTCRKGTGGK